mgnify:FL=1
MEIEGNTMVSGHNSATRIIHRIGEEIRATGEVASVTSWREALETFRAKWDIQVMNHNGFAEPPAVRDRLIRKHEIMLKYFERRYGEFYRSYDYAAPMDPVDPNMEGRVWICWWQGLENAPEIVKRCVESIQRNAGDHQVTIITDRNVEQYIDIPEWVKKKQSEGIISRTNLSDLLRLSLLAKYGGLWLDATFFCTGPLSDMAFGGPLFSIKRPDYLHCSIAQGYFAGYSLACDASHRRIFAAVRDFFLEYWKTNDFLVDYLLVDYMIVLAQRHNKDIADAFSAIKPNNPRCDDLYKVLGEPYDEEVWSKLTEETNLFKLTWKQEFPLEKDGRPTFYHYVLGKRTV